MILGLTVFVGFDLLYLGNFFIGRGFDLISFSMHFSRFSRVNMTNYRFFVLFLEGGWISIKKMFFFFIFWIRQIYTNLCSYRLCLFVCFISLWTWTPTFSLVGTVEVSLFKYFIKKKIGNRIIGSERWSLKHRTIEWISFDRVYAYSSFGWLSFSCSSSCTRWC